MRSLTVTRAARGTRHPETAGRHNNLAVLEAQMGGWPGAATEAEHAVAIMLSLDLAEHPDTSRDASYLAHFWEKSGQPDKATRLQRGDISDLLPMIAQVEAEHRAWVAEDPEDRNFGPPSPFASHRP